MPTVCECETSCGRPLGGKNSETCQEQEHYRKTTDQKNCVSNLLTFL